MITPELATGTAQSITAQLDSNGFYSVEFALDKPHPLYQFKIWRSDRSPMFVVVKENSAVLPKLKAGRIMNMTFYSSNTQCPRQQMRTRIGHIITEREGRFEGHCTIDLIPVNASTLQN